MYVCTPCTAKCACKRSMFCHRNGLESQALLTQGTENAVWTLRMTRLRAITCVQETGRMVVVYTSRLEQQLFAPEKRKKRDIARNRFSSSGRLLIPHQPAFCQNTPHSFGLMGIECGRTWPTLGVCEVAPWRTARGGSLVKSHGYVIDGLSSQIHGCRRPSRDHGKFFR